MAELQTNTPGTIEAHALARHVRMSPQKARLVIDLIRGQKAQDALQSLRYTPKRAAKHVEKVLRSAIANAEKKAEDSGAPLDVDQLYVNKCFVNEGSRWKRLRPAPMGRAFRYQKRTAHIWVGVSEHHVAAAERVAANIAEAEAQKGVRGTARRVRKALTGKQTSPKNDNEKAPPARGGIGKHQTSAGDVRHRKATDPRAADSRATDCTQHSFSCDWPRLSESIQDLKKALFGSSSSKDKRS